MLKSSQPNRELVVDCFAGGGGTSLGIEMAGLNVDIAINHDLDAIEMHKALVVPTIVTIGQTGGNGYRMSSAAEPLRTIVSKNEDCLVSATIIKNFTGAYGADIKKPMPTVTAIDHNSVVTANLIHYHGEKGDECRGRNRK